MRLLALSLGCALLTACSSVKARADYEPGLDFLAYRTFAMAPPPSETPVSLPSYSPIRGERINASIAQQLEAQGLARVDSESADLIVSFDLVGEPREDVRSSGGFSRRAGPHQRWHDASWYEPTIYTVAYVRGTLIVDAFDRARERIVWHGWSSVSLYSADDLAEVSESVIEAVMSQFPPR